MSRVRHVIEIERVIVRAPGVRGVDPSDLRGSIEQALIADMLRHALPSGAAAWPVVSVQVPDLGGGSPAIARVIASTVAGALSTGASNG